MNEKEKLRLQKKALWLQDMYEVARINEEYWKKRRTEIFNEMLGTLKILYSEPSKEGFVSV